MIVTRPRLALFAAALLAAAAVLLVVYLAGRPPPGCLERPEGFGPTAEFLPTPPPTCPGWER